MGNSVLVPRSRQPFGRLTFRLPQGDFGCHIESIFQGILLRVNEHASSPRPSAFAECGAANSVLIARFRSAAMKIAFQMNIHLSRQGFSRVLVGSNGKKKG
jgi:hypothetical protein